MNFFETQKSESSSKIKEILIEYKANDYFIGLDRPCQNPKFCLIKNKAGEELKVEAPDIIIYEFK